MAKIKKISELEQLSSLSSSSNIIIEENGKAKRFAASSLEGKVKTVNGVEPDENGNIQIKIAAEAPPIAGGVSSWNDLTDKPFYEENVVLDIKWDGEIGDRAYTQMDTDLYYVHVDDHVLTEELVGMTLGISVLSDGSTTEETMTITPESFIKYNENLVLIADQHLVVIGCDNFEFSGLSFEKAGIYFMKSTDAYVSSLNGEATVVAKLDNKYIDSHDSITINLSYTYDEETGEYTDVTSDVGFNEVLDAYNNGQGICISISAADDGYTYRQPAKIMGIGEMGAIFVLYIIFLDVESGTEVALIMEMGNYYDIVPNPFPMGSYLPIVGVNSGDMLVFDGDSYQWTTIPMENVGGSGLPEVSVENNGNVLTVVDGAWAAGEIEIPEMPEINYPVTSVNGQTGDVVIDVPSIDGLATETYVDNAVNNLNTLIGDKPVSEQIAEAIADIEIPEGSGDSGSAVQQDWNQNDPAQPDFVKNRTHWEENNQTVIEWDGEWSSLTYTETPLYKGTDEVPEIEDLIGGTVTITDVGDSETTFVIDNANIIELEKGIAYQVMNGDSGCAVMIYEEYMGFEIGLYLAAMQFNKPAQAIYKYCSKITYGSNTVHQLDPKFLPMAEGGYGWEEEVTPNVIRMAADTVIGTAYLGSTPYYPMVSDATPTWDDLTGATIRIVIGTNVNTVVLTEDAIAICKEESNSYFMSIRDDVLGNVELYIVLKDDYKNGSLLYPKKGVYICECENGVKLDNGLVVTITYGGVITHKIDEKFLPDPINTMVVTIDLIRGEASHSPTEIQEAHNAGHRVIATDDLDILYELRTVYTNGAVFTAVIPYESEAQFFMYGINPDKTFIQYSGTIPYIPRPKEEDYGKVPKATAEGVVWADMNAPKTEFVLSSPNGTNFRIAIDDSGKLIVSNMDGEVIEQGI